MRRRRRLGGERGGGSRLRVERPSGRRRRHLTGRVDVQRRKVQRHASGRQLRHRRDGRRSHGHGIGDEKAGRRLTATESPTTVPVRLGAVRLAQPLRWATATGAGVATIHSEVQHGEVDHGDMPQTARRWRIGRRGDGTQRRIGTKSDTMDFQSRNTATRQNKLNVHDNKDRIETELCGGTLTGGGVARCRGWASDAPRMCTRRDTMRVA